MKVWTDQDRPSRTLAYCLLVFTLLCVTPGSADQASDVNADAHVESGVAKGDVPDIRNEENPLIVQKGDFVAVPIPMSSPTFGTGLVAGAAYFYAQTPEQKKLQPASLTGAAAVYTSNESYAFGVGQQNYWDADKWRFTGLAGYVDFKFELRDPDANGNGELDWDVNGGIFQATLSRKIGGRWYAGFLARYLDITQDLVVPAFPVEFDVESNITSVAAGLVLQYDSRDLPTNAYEGRRLDGKAIFSRASDIDTTNYQGYYLRYRSYHQLEAPVVIALDINGCVKAGDFPLWDTCRINLRGFPLTDYLGKLSISAQIEARWRATERWGFVAFAGAGHISDSFSVQGDDEEVPSYGAGVRFMVLKSKRLNFRVDYARSDDGNAWYLAVGEAF